MACNYKKYIGSLLSLTAFFAFVLLPDVIYGWMSESFQADTSLKNIFIALIIALFLNFTASRRVSVGLLTLFFIMQASQLLYLHCYGSYYGASEIGVMLQGYMVAPEQSLTNPVFWGVPIAASLVLYLVALAVHLFFFTESPKAPFLSLLFVVALLVPFLQALSEDTSGKFLPNSTHLSLKNSLYSASDYAAAKVKIFINEIEQDTAEQ